MIPFHFFNSDARWLRSSDGLLIVFEMPLDARYCWLGAQLIARTGSRCNAVTSASGVPAGTSIAYHVSHSNPLSPLSSTVGISGARGDLVLLDIPSVLTRPDLTCGSTVAMLVISTCTSPDSSADMASPALL